MKPTLLLFGFLFFSLSSLFAQDGALDLTFNTTGIVTTVIGGRGQSVAIQPSDGKIVVAGSATNGTNDDFAVVRYNSNGTIDTGFGTSGKVITAIGSFNDYGNSVAIQSDGKIVVVGYTSNGSNNDIAVVCYNANGTLDAGFGTGGKVTTSIVATDDDMANGVTIQSDGKIIVAGVARLTGNLGGNYDYVVVRYNLNGTLDAGFGTNGIVTTDFGSSGDFGNSIAIQSDGKIVVAGRSYQNNGTINRDFSVARYNNDGSLDAGFGTGGKMTTAIGSANDVGNSVAIQTDGKIVVAGISSNGTNNQFAIVRYNSNGSLDTGFGIGGINNAITIGSTNDIANSVAIQSDGKLVVAGYTHIGNSDDFAVVRYNNNGTLDNTFDTDGIVTTNINSGYDYGYSVVIQPADGKIVVAGGSNSAFAVVRYSSALQQYSLSTTSNPLIGGTTTGDGTFNSGTSVNVAATPNSGYTFTNWTENGTVVSTSSTYTFTITGNRTLVANFTANPVQNEACITWSLLSSTAVTSTTGNISGQAETILGMEPFSSIPYTTNGQQLWNPITGWPASPSEDPARYVQFDASPTPGNTYTVTNVSFNYGDILNGANTDFNILKSKVYYSTNGWTSPGILLNPTPLAYLNTTMQSFSATGLNVPVGNGQTFSLRIYPYSPTGGLAMVRTFAVHNNVVICGTTATEVLNNGSICGMKFNDIDGDGVKDNGETGLTGWTISLTYGGLAAPVTLTKITGADGIFCFNDLAANTYTLSETSQSGYTQTFPTNPVTYTITLTTGQSVVGKDFGNHFCIPSISGSTPGSTCGAGTVTLGATASAGTINWYDTLTGGTSLGTGASFTTPSITATTTYYVDATDACGTTTGRTAVTATVYDLPIVSAPASVTAGSTITLSPTIGGSWISNNPTIASVTSAGVVTGLSAGTATFTFTDEISVCSATTSSVTVGSDCVFLCNTDFEISTPHPSQYNWIPQADVPCWHTTGSLGEIEIWKSGYLGFPAYTGIQFAELNAQQVGTFYQTFTAISGTTVNISFAHMGRYTGLDKMEVQIGPDGGPYQTIGTYYDNNSGWTLYSVSHTFLSSGPYQLRFASIYSNGGGVANVPDGGNFLDAIKIVCSSPNDATVTPGGPDAICQSASPSAITLIGASIGGSATTGAWSITSGGGTLSTTAQTASPASVTYTPAANYSGTVILKLTTNSIPAISATRTITINALPPAPAAITGTFTLCVGSTTQLADATSGGTWSSGTLGVATINASTGLVTGVTAGTSLITYTIGGVAVVCSNSVTQTVTVIASPTITGTTPATRCGEGTVILGATASAGTVTWYDALTGGNLVGTGNSFTTPSITSTTTYYVDATFGGCTTSDRIAVTATVNALPVISSPVSVNVNSTIILSPTTGGSWISNNPTIASVTPVGLVTGVSAGTATFTFTDAITGCSAITSSVIVISSTVCELLSATATKITAGDCCWSISLTQPSNTSGINRIQFLALSPNTFIAGSSLLSSGDTGWLFVANSSNEFTVKRPGVGDIPPGQLDNFFNFCLNNLSSPQSVVVNWLNASNEVVCSDTVKVNCDIPCVTFDSKEIICNQDNYTLQYSFTNNSTFAINKIEVDQVIPVGITVTPSMVTIPSVLIGGNSGMQTFAISGANPNTTVAIIFKFTSSDGCCACTDTLYVTIPSCMCEEVSSSLNQDPLNCCATLNISNNYSGNYFTQVNLTALNGVTFGTWTTNSASDWYSLNTFTSNSVHLYNDGNNGFIPSGNSNGILNFCLTGYTSTPQQILIVWMRNDSIQCVDTLTTTCIPPPSVTDCVQFLDTSLVCLSDGSFEYKFKVKNNSTHTTTGFKLNTVSPLSLSFSPADFSSVSIAPSMTSPEQTLIISGVNPNAQFCFEIALYEHIIENNDTLYSWCCHSDTICITTPDCGDELGSICGMKFNDLDGNGVKDNTTEPGLSGWPISLTYYDASGALVTLTTTTGADGSYCFNDLAANTYTLFETQLGGWDQTYPVAQGNYSITLLTGQTIVGKDFGNKQTTPCIYLCNTDFEEFDNIQGPAGSVQTKQDNIPCWQTTASDDKIEIWHSGFGLVPAFTGSYFAELNATQVGTLYQTFYAASAQSVIVSFAHRGRYAGNDVMEVRIGLENDPPSSFTLLGTYTDNNTAWTYYTTAPYFIPGPGTYTLKFVSVSSNSGAGPNNGGNFLDAINVTCPSSICGIKFNDINGDGQKQATDPVIPNWPIKLTFNDASGTLVTLDTTTGADGSYCFNSLMANTYTIAETQVDGWMQTFPLSQGAHTVILATDQNISGQNFGNQQLLACCDKVKVDPFADPAGACCAKVTATCEVKAITVTVTNGVLSSADWNCGPLGTAYIGLASYTFAANDCVPVLNTCFKATTTGIVTVTYDIEFSNGEKCRKSIDLKCIIPTCCEQVKAERVTNADGTPTCCAKITATCKVKEITVTVTNGTLSSVGWDCSAIIPIGCIGQSAYTFAANDCALTMSTCVNAKVSGVVTITYDIVFSNGEKCRKTVYLECIATPPTSCCEQVNVERFSINTEGKNECCARIISTCKVKEVNVVIENGTISSTSWNCGPLPGGYVGQSDFTFAANGCVIDMTNCIRPNKPGLVVVYYTIYFENGEKCEKKVELDCSLASGCVTPPSEMKAWWPLDETDISKTGSISNDLAGFNNVGTRVNGPVPLPAKVLGGLQFDGIDDYVEVPFQTDLNFGKGDFSFDTWILTTDAGGIKDLICKRELVTHSGYLIFLWAGKLGLELGDGTFEDYLSPVFVADGNWHHIAVTVSRTDPNGIIFYLDGVPTSYGDPTSHQASLDNSSKLRIGSNNEGVAYLFKGILDEIELFNRVLTKDEIFSIFNAGSAGKCKPTGLLGSICGTKFNDLNGNGQRDKDEPGIAEWTIELGGNAEMSVLTDKNGDYCFTGLEPGDYKIAEKARVGWSQLMPAAQGIYELTLLSGQKIFGKDFGNRQDITNGCDNFNFELRKIYKGDSISYACILTNKYTGKELAYIPKSFSIKIKNNLVIAVDDYAPKEWNRTPSKFPPGSSQIKWTNNSGDIPNGESNLGAIHFGVPTANPFYVVYEWLNVDGKVICKDSIALTETIKLISPDDGAKILDGLRPTFEWIAPELASATYKIKIVEILGDQSPDQAMLMNAPWYENTDIQGTSFNYPGTALRLEPYQLYGWLVDYFLGGQPINGLTEVSSEIRTFTIQGSADPAKVSVLLQQPMPYRFYAEDLWNGTLTNLGGTTLKVLLTGTLEKTGTGKIVESKTDVLSLNPGKTAFFFTDFNTELVNSIFDRWGDLIAGNGDYTACIQVKNESGVEIGSACIVQKVETPTSSGEVKLQQPYNLEQNYPNPFNSTSTIGYSIPQTSFVKIIVYDLFGKEIKVLVNEEKDSGHHEIVFDREDFVSGIYFYTLRTAGFTQSKKMIIMK